MWDDIMYSSRERDEFPHYFQDTFTEDTLTLHELYLEKITKFYNEYKNIFDLIVSRKELWLKMTELEARSSEPGRYHNRGGQLLKEEKERKTIASKLPKIEAQIRELVTKYEAETGRTFTVKSEHAKRKLNYEGDQKRTPKVTVNGCILKHKRTICRSSMAVKEQDLFTVQKYEQSENTPQKAPRTKAPLTPKPGKENIQRANPPMTPKSNLMYTPTRLTRSAVKLPNDGFATPRTPLGATKTNIQRTHTDSRLNFKTTPNNVNRSKSHTLLVRAKDLPPLI
ncbi:Protein regulator of cytokinesis 1 [Operophtera brumata]|uniref:Protein regulator of cytokinesis 1 n=1 Tax=Operophtera brumata TaxID=104452 RepID=A0A0L7LI98_OPEBR|nr:Protein regulator of cytokinesis 1 [Operophtera brumata]